MKTKEFIKMLTDDAEDRLRIRISIEKSNIIDIMIQYEAKFNDEWHIIVRYDCSHGFFHRDIMYPNGNKQKQPLMIKNLDDALLYAEQDIKDRWNWYKESYKRRLKNEKR